MQSLLSLSVYINTIKLYLCDNVNVDTPSLSPGLILTSHTAHCLRHTHTHTHVKCNVSWRLLRLVCTGVIASFNFSGSSIQIQGCLQQAFTICIFIKFVSVRFMPFCCCLKIFPLSKNALYIIERWHSNQLWVNFMFSRPDGVIDPWLSLFWQKALALYPPPADLSPLPDEDP